MHLYPAIDIKNGQCVRLTQGDFQKTTVYNRDPVVVAKKWQEQGARFLHVVDLDGATSGRWVNRKVIKKIVAEVDIPVQTGGGIRSLSDIEQRFQAGVERVIIGTKGIKKPAFLLEAVQQFGADKIVVSLDARKGYIALYGWKEISTEKALDFALCIEKMGIKHVVYTDIDKDGMLGGPNLAETQRLIEESNLDIIASGGIHQLADLDKLQAIGVAGCIIGKALYTDKINLKEAIDHFERD